MAPDVGDEVPVLYARSDPGLATIDTLWGTFGSSVWWLLLGSCDSFARRRETLHEHPWLWQWGCTGSHA
jgi:hypothetical protein